MGSEMCIRDSFQYSPWLAAVAALGVILAAAYLLWMFQRTMFNDRGDDEVKPSFALKDLSAREIASLVPLVVFVIWLGVYPQTFLAFLHVPVQVILQRVTPSMQEASASVHGLAQLFEVTRGLV